MSTHRGRVCYTALLKRNVTRINVNKRVVSLLMILSLAVDDQSLSHVWCAEMRHWNYLQIAAKILLAVTNIRI